MHITIYQHGRDARSIPVSIGQRLIDVLSHCGVYLDAPCGGHCLCGKCKVRVAGTLSQPSAEELLFLSEQERQKGFRLACAAQVLGDASVWIDTQEDMLVQMDARSQVQLCPYIDVLLNEGKWEVYRDGILLERNDERQEYYGMAVDIGTTTVAAYCYHLLTGQKIFEDSATNPQRVFGGDVIARIGACMKDSQNLKKQQSLIVDLLNQMVQHAGLDYNRFFEFCVTGNTTMLHLLDGLDPSGIANFPFTPQSLFGTLHDPSEIGLKANRNAALYLTPCCSAYVGGDITSGMLACGLLDAEQPTLYIDIGTNGEMALAMPDRIITCSTAAGPAFEGAGIAYGMSGVRGAISNVWVKEGTFCYSVIGDVAPQGICGSGILDAIACLLELGIVDQTGRLLDADEVPHQYRKLYTVDGDVLLAEAITVTAQDVREIQLAKAAIAAGISTLLHEAGILLDDVGSIVIAGGFGAHINVDSACRIGLLPRRKGVVSVGNAAGLGAIDVLLDQTARQRLEQVKDKCEYIELSGHAFFEETYVDHLFYPEK